jgi:DsbC/DsbD-like thiol-disulfide interchange protein
MRTLAIIACLAVPVIATSSSSGIAFVPVTTSADAAGEAARSSLAHDVDLAEQAMREARAAEAARAAKRAAEEAERLEAARRSEQAKQAEQAARMETRRKAALELPPLPQRSMPPAETEPQVASQAATEWRPGHQARVRMIAGDIDFLSRGWSYAGVQMELAAGWKTYWRNPGDTGFPPTFDWSGSRNLKSAEVLYPAPHKYRDAYSTSVGYKHEVVLPVRLTAKDPTKPVEVHLRFGYGLCEQICVPGEAELHLVMPPRQAGKSELLSRFTSMVPRRVHQFGQQVHGFAIDNVDVRLDGDAPAITIDARVPADTDTPDMLIEASDNFYLPLPSEEQGVDGNHKRYRIDLTKSDPAQQLHGKTLALTLVGEHSGIEYHHKID